MGKRVFALDSAKLSSSSAPALAEADLAAYALVQAKIPAQQLALADGLAGLGFRLVEGEVDLVLALERERAAEPGDGAQTSVWQPSPISRYCVPRRLRRSPSAAFARLGINLMTAAGFMLCGLKRPF